MEGLRLDALRLAQVLIAGVALIASAALHAATGRTAAQFEVSSTGEAGYTIPLFAPPGPGGMSPKLALVYGHRTGASPAGVGFSIEGASAITRCPKPYAQDGAPRGVKLDRYDRFCLDGNQLKLYSGTYGAAGATYRTEIETFARITSYGAISYPTGGTGPTHFIVEAKDGLLYEYGNSTDSRIEALGQTLPHTWALSKVRDRSGNYMTFGWFEDTTHGGYHLTAVAWAGNATLRHLAGLFDAPHL